MKSLQQFASGQLNEGKINQKYPKGTMFMLNNIRYFVDSYYDEKFVYLKNNSNGDIEMKSLSFIDKNAKELMTPKEMKALDKANKPKKEPKEKIMTTKQFEKIISGAVSDMGDDTGYSELMDVAQNIMMDYEINKYIESRIKKDNLRFRNKWERQEWLANQMANFA